MFQDIAESRAGLMEIYCAALDRVQGTSVVREYLSRFPLPNPVHLVAIGKAASAMSLGAVQASGDKITGGLVITKNGHLDKALVKLQNFRCLESDHPVPGAASLHAGTVLLEYVKACANRGQGMLFLLSGGASSLVEVLPDTMRLEDLSVLTSCMLAADLDIQRMNTVRRAISRIKGGRLATHLKGCRVLSLLISDVPGDDPAVIGSGLLTPVRETLDLASYPENVRELLGDLRVCEVPGDEFFVGIETQIVACLEDAKQAAAKHARALGLQVRVAPEFVAGEAGAAARTLVRQLWQQSGVLWIWGGETWVELPPNPARGGRNQHLALVAAMELQGARHQVLLSAGTDGTDGPTNDAGAIVDGETVQRGMNLGLDADDFLRRADAGNFLSDTGDLITTGPTGTNVMDLVIGINLNVAAPA